MVNMTAGGDTTIQNFIQSYRSDVCTFDTCFYKEVITTLSGKHIIINGDSVFDRYATELNQFKSKITLSDEEYRKYRFNPKRMSFDLYGTTEMWFLLLHANELTSVSEFDSEVVYAYDGGLLKIIGKLIDLEQVYMDYQEDLNSKILNS